MEKTTKKAVKRILAAVVLLGMDGAAMYLFHHYSSFFFPAYRTFSKAWIGMLSAITGIFPFAVWDIGAVCLVLLFLGTFLYVLIHHRSFLNWLSHVLLIVSIVLFEVVYGWMLNHYAPSLDEEIGLNVTEYSKEELYEACDYYLQEAAIYAQQVERDEEGNLVTQDFDDLAVTAGSLYTSLGEQYEIFRGSSVRVKKLSVIGTYLMYNGIIGMFMPVTGEAGVPGNVPDAPKPYTMAHEAAHRLGIASEQEANFAAFLACSSSDDLQFLYSGYYSAFGYCFSSLYGTDPELALSLYEQYSEDAGVQLVRLDRSDTYDVYESYESKLQEVSDQINDTYLKTFAEEDGIRSYGMVTDDLIAWYESEVKGE